MASLNRRSNRIILVLVFCSLLSLSFVSATKIECKDDGSLKIDDSLIRNDVTARLVKAEDNYFPVKGAWSSREKTEGKKKVTYYTYESQDGIFVAGEPTSYYIKIGKKRYTAKCPIFSFSCRMLNQSFVESCYMRNDTFVGKFLINDLSISKNKEFRFANPYSLNYNAKLDTNRVIRHTPVVTSEGFENFTITMKRKNDGNRFTLKWDTDKKIKEFMVYYQCEKSGFSIAKECSELPLCEKNNECMADEICENSICQKLDCNTCEYIDPLESHQCKKYQCCGDDECGNDEICNNNSCQKFECLDNEIIKDHSCESLNCMDDEITINHSCQKLECEFDEIVKNHQCEKIICKEDEKLENHQCIALQCKWYEKMYDHDCYTWYQQYKLKKEDTVLKEQSLKE